VVRDNYARWFIYILLANNIRCDI